MPHSLSPLKTRLTHRAHQILQSHLAPGDLAVDATAGNGHDTCFLARVVAPAGRVYAFDIQPQALAQTRTRLAREGLDETATLFLAGHERLAETLPEPARGRLTAVMFNLGYLPGGDRQTTTTTPSTLAALQQSVQLLKPGGLLSVLAYRQHPGGAEESQAVQAFLEKSGELSLEAHPSPGPVLFIARKKGS
jgi:predicted methyltransferase